MITTAAGTTTGWVEVNEDSCVAMLLDEQQQGCSSGGSSCAATIVDQEIRYMVSPAPPSRPQDVELDPYQGHCADSAGRMSQWES